MTYDTLFTITEWEWFKLQLRIYSLESVGEYWKTIYKADEENKTITCRIWCNTTQRLIDKNAPIEEHRKFYDTWFDGQQYQINQIAQQLPALSQVFSAERDVIVEIFYNYGMGSTLVCRYKGDAFTWLYPEDEKREPKRKRKTSK